MKWHVHILYENGERKAEARVLRDAAVSIDVNGVLQAHGHSASTISGRDSITLRYAHLTRILEEGKLYFQGAEDIEHGNAIVSQALMLEPGKDHDPEYDMTYRYPLEAAGPLYMRNDELPVHFDLDDMHRHSHFRLERDQIEAMLRRIHNACGKRFEAWLRREILGEADQ